MSKSFEDILEALPRFRKAADQSRDVLLSNLVFLGEIPAPTFYEQDRIEFLQNRFSECGLQHTSTDEMGNGLGVVPGRDGQSSILVVAHADTVHSRKEDHTISVDAEKVTGPGVGDNSLGLAVLATLPALLESLHIELNADLILMGASRSLGRGNLEGLRFFLKNTTRPLRAGLSIEGVQLGRLSIGSIGMLRGEISCTVPEEYDWTRFGASGAILTINDVINKITAIELPKKPRTTIVLGSVEGGSAFNTVATHALLRFEIRSESHEMVERMTERVRDIVAEASAQTESDVSLHIVARREPGGIPFAHPLSRSARRILEELGVEHRENPSTSELSAFIDKRIPAVTVGITSGEHVGELRESVEIEPMATGLAQIIAMILAIDGGFCDEHQ